MQEDPSETKVTKMQEAPPATVATHRRVPPRLKPEKKAKQFAGKAEEEVTKMQEAPSETEVTKMQEAMPSKDALHVRSATKRRKNVSFQNKLCEMKSVRWNGRQALCATRAEAANYARRVANGRKPVNSVMGRKFAKAVKKYTVAAVVFLKLLECSL